MKVAQYFNKIKDHIPFLRSNAKSKQHAGSLEPDHDATPGSRPYRLFRGQFKHDSYTTNSRVSTNAISQRFRDRIASSRLEQKTVPDSHPRVSPPVPNEGQQAVPHKHNKHHLINKSEPQEPIASEDSIGKTSSQMMITVEHSTHGNFENPAGTTKELHQHTAPNYITTGTQTDIKPPGDNHDPAPDKSIHLKTVYIEHFQDQHDDDTIDNDHVASENLAHSDRDGMKEGTSEAPKSIESLFIEPSRNDVPTNIKHQGPVGDENHKNMASDHRLELDTQQGPRCMPTVLYEAFRGDIDEDAVEESESQELTLPHLPNPDHVRQPTFEVHEMFRRISYGWRQRRDNALYRLQHNRLRAVLFMIAYSAFRMSQYPGPLVSKTHLKLIKDVTMQYVEEPLLEDDSSVNTNGSLGDGFGLSGQLVLYDQSHPGGFATDFESQGYSSRSTDNGSMTGSEGQRGVGDETPTPPTARKHPRRATNKDETRILRSIEQRLKEMSDGEARRWTENIVSLLEARADNPRDMPKPIDPGPPIEIERDTIETRIESLGTFSQSLRTLVYGLRHPRAPLLPKVDNETRYVAASCQFLVYLEASVYACCQTDKHPGRREYNLELINGYLSATSSQIASIHASCMPIQDLINAVAHIFEEMKSRVGDILVGWYGDIGVQPANQPYDVPIPSPIPGWDSDCWRGGTAWYENEPWHWRAEQEGRRIRVDQGMFLRALVHLREETIAKTHVLRGIRTQLYRLGMVVQRMIETSNFCRMTGDGPDALSGRLVSFINYLQEWSDRRVAYTAKNYEEIGVYVDAFSTSLEQEMTTALSGAFFCRLVDFEQCHRANIKILHPPEPELLAIKEIGLILECVRSLTNHGPVGQQFVQKMQESIDQFDTKFEETQAYTMEMINTLRTAILNHALEEHEALEKRKKEDREREEARQQEQAQHQEWAKLQEEMKQQEARQQEEARQAARLAARRRQEAIRQREMQRKQDEARQQEIASEQAWAQIRAAPFIFNFASNSPGSPAFDASPAGTSSPSSTASPGSTAGSASSGSSVNTANPGYHTSAASFQSQASPSVQR